MADRVKVTEPITGTELTVSADSPQAKLWGKSKDDSKAPAKKAASSKSEK